jgi:hypothetical protein
MKILHPALKEQIEVEYKSPLLECRLHILTSFQRQVHVGERNGKVEKEYHSQET